MIVTDIPSTTRMTIDDAHAAIGRCVQYGPTGDLATLVTVSHGAVLIRYDAGGTHWVTPAHLERRADLDGRPLPARRRRRA